MNFEETFPLRFYINLGRREDRRTETEWLLDQAGISAERFPAVDARFVRNARGYENKGRYALALTIRLAIREAKHRKSPSLLLFEDDVVFHPNFRELVERIELPDDWGLFYFGCQHYHRPTPLNEYLVKVNMALDSHAWAIRAEHYDSVMKAIDFSCNADPNHLHASDQAVARLHNKVPTYACYPNLAWQAVEESDLTGRTYSFYGKTGEQRINKPTVENILQESLAPEAVGREPKLALLCLTRGDLHHPDIWQEWGNQSPNKVAFFAHAKNPDELKGGFLEGKQIDEYHETEWAEVSLVQATLALLNAALKDESVTHFTLVSESCVPIKPLREVMLRLKHDGRCQFGYKTFEEASEFARSRARITKGIPDDCWRFHSQWFLLNREAAKIVVRKDYTEGFKNYFASDESYFGTVLAMEGYPVDDLVYNHNVTWVHWDKTAPRHPTSHKILKGHHLTDILHSDALFARKFPPEADIREYELHHGKEFSEISKVTRERC
jgi:hypothetical protein